MDARFSDMYVCVLIEILQHSKLRLTLDLFLPNQISQMLDEARHKQAIKYLEARRKQTLSE